ncbi:MAG: glycerate kinase [Propionibacteriaceae bacterium]|nr:glycerate kinase [Propionibacteriaceae bacterium]
MRVLIATDGLGGHSSEEAGAAFARAWAGLGAEVAVVPMASGGPGLPAALASLGCREPVLDLTVGVPDSVPPGAIGVVSADQLELPLTGLRGLAATQGRLSGSPLEEVLAGEARWEAWARQAWPGRDAPDKVPGSGAHQGAGLRVLAAGGRLTTGEALCAELAGLDRSAELADLVVTGCEVLDFGSFGGPVVAEVLRRAQGACRPLIVLAGRSYISARELRSAGIEACYALDGEDASGTVKLNQLSQLAARVARSWAW